MNVRRASSITCASACATSRRPDEYDHDPDCYAVFFCDPDGVKLEVLHVRR
jgi:hypothetical protein